MYYRRKIILSLLQVFENQLEKINLQKLLLLFTKQQLKPAYHFVPYKFGCYSFQANADLNTMVKYDMVTDNGNTWRKIDTKDYFVELRDHDRNILKEIKRLYANKSKNDLIRITYLKYPYFALNSSITESVLSPDEIKNVSKIRPIQNDTIIFTIGYEGSSLEEYLNKLIINNIKVLCDVRKNPLSMKYGFSKNQLKNACEGVGIEYIHIPELGIDSDKRQELNNQSDYDRLFLQYRQTTLVKTRHQQQQLLRLLENKKRIALTCFEANIHQCHRKHLAEAIATLPDFDYELKHI
jgi:hypothetical protein